MIAYRVIAVPQRLAMATELAQHVGGQVVLDGALEGSFRTHVRALGTAGDATHVVVLEDDAILCPDFTAHIERLVAARPTHLLGLYVGRAFPRRLQPVVARLLATPSVWLEDFELTSALWWAVGYVMPTADLSPVFAELEGGLQHPWLHTDRRLGNWHAAQGRLSYPFPSPVDHNDDTPSMLSKSKHGRVAWAHCEGQAP